MRELMWFAAILSLLAIWDVYGNNGRYTLAAIAVVSNIVRQM